MHQNSDRRTTAGGFWTGISVIIVKVFARKPELNTPGLMWFVAAAVTDFLITGSLIFSLSRRRTGFAATDSAVNRIIRLTIQTGLVTSLFALADLIAFLVSPQTAVSFVWDFSLSKLYTNALLSTLNARAGWSNLNSNGQNPDNVLFGNDPSAYSDPRGINSLSASQNFHSASTMARNFSRTGASATVADTFEMNATKIGTQVGKDVHIKIDKEVEMDFPTRHEMTQ